MLPPPPHNVLACYIRKSSILKFKQYLRGKANPGCNPDRCSAGKTIPASKTNPETGV
jgi:hypothetical protein